MCKVNREKAKMDELKRIEFTDGLQNIVNQFTSQIDTISKATKDTYKYAIKQYLNFLNETRLEPTQIATVKAYKEYLLDQNYKASTVNSYLMTVKQFYGFLDDEKICDNVAKKVKKVRESDGFKKDCLTIEQVKRILNNMDRTTLKGKRDFALMNLLICTGVRTVEAVRASVGDIRNNGTQTVLYVQGKGHLEKDNFVVLPENVQIALGEYLAERKNVTTESPLFDSVGNRSHGTPLHVKSVSRIVKRIFKENGLVSDRLTAHSTRHTACTLALLTGASLQEVQCMARHKNINTTLIYSHNLNRLENNAESKIASLFA